MKKPTILIINELLPKYKYLENKYNLIYKPINYQESPFDQAEKIINDLKENNIVVDGVFALLDFHSEITAIIAEKLSLIHTSTKSIYTSQNKALFASLMKKNNVSYPETTAFDISKPLPTFNYPVFIRPVRGSFSAGAYIIRSDEELQKAQLAIQKDDALVPQGFELFLLYFDSSLKPVRNKYIAQPYINTNQYVADGFVFNKKMHIFALTKATYTNDRKSFYRYDFPVTFSEELSSKLQKTLEKTIEAVEYNNSGFNVEFFVTEENEIIIIELNTRITPGFLNLFDTQYEVSPFEMMIELSLGKMPKMTVNKTHIVASGFPLRLPYDCWVTDVPSHEELERFKKEYDILELEVLVKKNTKLSDYRQDAYSFCYGRVDISGKDTAEISEKYHRFMENLPIKLKKI